MIQFFPLLRQNFQFLPENKSSGATTSVWKQIIEINNIPQAVDTIRTTLDIRKQVKAGMGLKYKMNYPIRQSATVYTLYSIVIPSINSEYAYQCTTPGTSGSSVPNFNTILGSTTTDGTVTWTTISLYQYGIVKFISDTLITIGGVSLDYDITELYACSQAFIKEWLYEFSNSTWSSSMTASVQRLYYNIPFEVFTGKIIYARTYQLLQDTGISKASIRIMKNNSHILKNNNEGIVLVGDRTYNDTGVEIVPAYYDYSFLNELRFDVFNAGTNKNTQQALIKIYQIIEE